MGIDTDGCHANGCLSFSRAVAAQEAETERVGAGISVSHGSDTYPGVTSRGTSWQV